MTLAQLRPIRSVIALTQDAYTPVPADEDLFDIAICELCNLIGRKLRFAEYTVSDVKTIWNNSRKNEESLDIICDITCLTPSEATYLLSIEGGKISLAKSNIGMSEYWTGSPRLRNEVLV